MVFYSSTEISQRQSRKWRCFEFFPVCWQCLFSMLVIAPYLAILAQVSKARSEPHLSITCRSEQCCPGDSAISPVEYLNPNHWFLIQESCMSRCLRCGFMTWNTWHRGRAIPFNPFWRWSTKRHWTSTTRRQWRRCTRSISASQQERAKEWSE